MVRHKKILTPKAKRNFDIINNVELSTSKEATQIKELK
jgi:hypothetical protein